VVVSSGVKEDLVNSYNIAIENVEIIPNGANTTLFRPMDQQNTKREIGLKPEKKYACFIGNLAPWQGVEYLIKAAPFVIKYIPEVMFLIVGDGTVRKELETRVKEMNISDYFLFTGSVIYDRVPYYINASDICISIKKPVLPGSPLKVFEYMACGKPVIATKKSAYGFEILEEFGAGLLVDQDNPEEISNAITYLLKNPEESKKMGIAGRKVVIDNYSWRNTALKVEQICSSALMK
jgi:glycosyltransferase involved in cell wall biosynthesis